MTVSHGGSLTRNLKSITHIVFEKQMLKHCGFDNIKDFDRNSINTSCYLPKSSNDYILSMKLIKSYRDCMAACSNSPDCSYSQCVKRAILVTMDTVTTVGM